MAFLKDDDNLDDSVVVVPLHEEGASDAIEALEGLHFLAKKGKRSESRVWAPIKKCALELANAAASPATLNAAKQVLLNLETPGAKPFKGVNLSQVRRISGGKSFGCNEG